MLPAGADLLAETPEVMEWLLRCGKEAAGPVAWIKYRHCLPFDEAFSVFPIFSYIIYLYMYMYV